MPTELFDDIGIHIAKKGGEVGATTGRPEDVDGLMLLL